MFQDDKCGIGYGLMGLLQDDARFVTFNGTKWSFDADALGAHVKKIKEAGGNFIRALAYGVWGSHPGQKKTYQFQPYVLSGDKWDLGKFNTHYFPIVEKAFSIINEEGMTVLFDLFDNCQFHGGYRKWSPWYSNVQRITSFYEKDADKYTKAWISTWIVRAKRKNLDIIWGLNEAENLAYPDFFKRIIIPYMKRGLIDPNRTTYGATTKIGPTDSVQDQVRHLVEDQFGMKASRDMIMEDHGYPFAVSLPVWGNKPNRKMYSDDGFYGGKSLCDKRDKRARPSAVEWGARAKYILDHYPSSASGRPRLISFEHLPGFYPPNDVCQAATIRAISGAYRIKFGAWPKNYKP